MTRAFLLALLLTACGRFGIDRRDEHGMTALMRAAAAGDRARAEQLLAAGADVNAVVPRRDFRELVAFLSWMQQLPSSDIGYTPLHYAAMSGHADVARLLLDRGADATRAGERAGLRPLDIAVFRSDTGMIRTLIASGAKPDARQLYMAVTSAGADVVKLLLEHGADPNARPGTAGAGSVAPPLSVAAVQRGDTTILKLLIAARMDLSARDQNGWTALRWLDSRGSRQGTQGTRVRELLTASGASDASGASNAALLAAVRANSLRAVRDAISAGADPNAPDEGGLGPLTHAVGSPEIVSALVRAGASVNVVPRYGPTPLIAAVRRGTLASAQVLLDAGARADLADGLGQTPLQIASAAGDAKLVALLLAHGAKPDAGALGRAALGGSADVVTLLLDGGADPNADNGVALSEATRGCARHDGTPVIRVLLERGARPRGDDYALHRAVGLCSLEAVRLLVKHGAPVDARGPNGETALMAAAFDGRLDEIRLLVAAGASVNALDLSGRSALQYAASHADAQQLLRTLGAR